MVMPRLARTVLAALVLALAGSATLAAQDEGSKTNGGRKLATIPDDLELSQTSRGPDGTAYTTYTRFVFGRDGAFVAYSGFRGGKGVAMASEEELGEFDFLHQPVTDAAHTHFAFRAGSRKSPTKEQWWAIVDGKKGKSYAWISSVAVNGDGEAAFWEQPGAKVQQSDGAYNRSSVVFHAGRKTSKKFDDVPMFDPVWSADGKTALTAAQKGREWVPITVTRRGAKADKRGHPMIDDAVLAPDGKRFALVVTVGGMPLPPGVPAPPGQAAGKPQVFVDGKAYGDDTDGAGGPVFAPRGKRFAYRYLDDAKMGLAFDTGKQTKADWDYVGEVTFDGKGKQVAFTANVGGKVNPYFRLRNVDNPLELAPGGTWSLHTWSGKGDAEAIVEGVEAARFPTFGPTGELAFVQRAKGRWYVTVAGRRSEGYDDIDQPFWGDQGKSIAFGARRDRDLLWQVLELQ